MLNAGDYLTLALAGIASLAVAAAWFSALAASRSATAAELSARSARDLLDLQSEGVREQWSQRLATVIESNRRGKSSIPAARLPVANLLEGLPASLRDEEKSIVELAYKRTTTESGFPGFWQELDGARGRGILANRS